MKARLSFGFLEAEYRGAHRPNGGNPGLWWESGPRPPTWVGAGAQGPKNWDVTACEGHWPAGWLAGWLAGRPASRLEGSHDSESGGV